MILMFALNRFRPSLWWYWVGGLPVFQALASLSLATDNVSHVRLTVRLGAMIASGAVILRIYCNNWSVVMG